MSGIIIDDFQKAIVGNCTPTDYLLECDPKLGISAEDYFYDHIRDFNIPVYVCSECGTNLAEFKYVTECPTCGYRNYHLEVCRSC